MTGAEALEKLGLTEHPTVVSAHQQGYAFVPVGPSLADHPTHFEWEAPGGESVSESQVAIRVVFEASGVIEVNWLSKIVVWGAKQALKHSAEHPTTGIVKGPVKFGGEGLKTGDGGVTSMQLGGTHDTDEGEIMQKFMANTFPKLKMTTETPIKLEDSSMMYQPVKGSGGGSRYFVVGIGTLEGGASLKVAARVKESSVSVRMEGTAIQYLTKELKSCGLSNMPKGYASVHVDVSSTIMAGKVIGAILASMPKVRWDTPVPEVSQLVGKGQ